MKRAVVLCGGGSKGSYQIGAWKALKEMRIDYQIVVGNSIGALNGALMVLDNFDTANEMWDNLTIDKIMIDGINFDYSFETIVNQKTQIKTFLKKYANQKGSDITPLKNLLEEIINEEQIRNSNIDLGLLMVLFPSLKPVEITKNQIPKGELINHLLASASCFPAFPMTKIGKNNYLDGGFYDDLPIDLAVKIGCDEIIAIDLHFNPTHPNYMNLPFVTYIKPSWHLGSFLSFIPEIIAQNKILGYNDTKKAFSLYDGFRFTFEKVTSKENTAKEYLSLLSLFEACIPMESKLLKLKSGKNFLFSYLRDNTNNKSLTYTDFYIRGAEICAELLNFDHYRVYDIDNLNQMLLTEFSDISKFNYNELFKNLITLRETIKTIDSKYLLGCLFYKLLNSQNMYQDLKWFAVILPKELIAALYLYINKNE